MADALALGASGAIRGGSSPLPRTMREANGHGARQLLVLRERLEARLRLFYDSEIFEEKIK